MIVPFLRELFTVTVVVDKKRKKPLLSKDACDPEEAFGSEIDIYVKQGEQAVSSLKHVFF